MKLPTRFIQLGFVAALAAPLSTNAQTFVPISVGDITIIIPIDNAPVANNDLIQNIPERHTDLDVTISVIDNDVDENPASLTVQLISNTSGNGQPVRVASDNQSIIYTTLPGWNGTDTIEYQTVDEAGQISNTAVATVMFVDSNDPPAAAEDRFLVRARSNCNANSPNTISHLASHCRYTLGNIFNNDIDDGGSNVLQLNEITLAGAPQPSRNFFGDGLTYYDTANFGYIHVTTGGDAIYIPTPQAFNSNVDFIDYTTVDSSGLVSNRQKIVFDIDDADIPVVLPIVEPTLPTSNQTILPSQQVIATANASDAGGSIRWVEFSVDNGRTWVRDTSQPYSHNFGTLLTGDYVAQYRTQDNTGNDSQVKSVAFSVGIVPNIAPQLASFSVTPSGPYNANTSIGATATATDADGVVDAIRFRVDGGNWIVDSTSPTYSADFGTLSLGSHIIEFQARDNEGEYSSIASRSVTVVNSLPTLSSITPPNGATYTADQTVVATAVANDNDGTIAAVEFRLDGGIWVSDSSGPSPYSTSYSGLGIGAHTIQYRAQDNIGEYSDIISRSITITEAPNVIPTVNVISPAANATYQTFQPVIVTATANDTDGDITAVEARVDGGDWITNTGTASPYEIDLGTLGQGAHTIEVRSRDDDGEYSDITVRNIVVTAPPRRIIYIHTDALGSPASETNEQGEQP